MSTLAAAHTPKMLEWAARQIDTKEAGALIDALVQTGAVKGVRMQVVAVTALCIVADKRLGDGWLAVGQMAHSIQMQAQERYARYGESAYPLSEKQLACVVRAVLEAKELSGDEWV